MQKMSEKELEIDKKKHISRGKIESLTKDMKRGR